MNVRRLPDGPVDPHLRWKRPEKEAAPPTASPRSRPLHGYERIAHVLVAGAVREGNHPFFDSSLGQACVEICSSTIDSALLQERIELLREEPYDLVERCLELGVVSGRSLWTDRKEKESKSDKWPEGRPSKVPLDRLLAKLAECRTLSQCAAHFGVHPRSLSTRLKVLGIKHKEVRGTALKQDKDA